MDIKQKYAQRLRLLRNEAGISQEELAFRANLDRTYINSVENGKRNISIVNIEISFDIVAEKNNDCFCLGNLATILCISLTNPISSILSASSKTK